LLLNVICIISHIDDFKPASVDINKAAKLDVSSNNQVTVTVPHLGNLSILKIKVVNKTNYLCFYLISDGSGVPNTVFKGNQREYAKKECVLIINRDTGEIVLERLHNNIQVKKTRYCTSKKNFAYFLI
jgi:ELL-associated factor